MSADADAPGFATGRGASVDTEGSRSVLLLSLTRPESFQAGLRAPGVQVDALRVQYRALRDIDRAPGQPACMVGFVLPKRLCRAAVRRNLIRRVMRAVLRDALRDPPTARALGGRALIVRLTDRLPPQFVSAASPALRAYLRVSAQQLLQLLLRRGGSSGAAQR